MSAADFESHKRSLINKRLEKFKNLESESHRLWAYISSEYYEFHQVDRDVEAIRPLTKDEVQDFFAEYIDPESEKRAKVSVHMVAQGILEPVEGDAKPGEQEEQFVELLSQFLQSQGADVTMEMLKNHFANTDLSKEEQVVASVKSCLGDTTSKSQIVETTEQIKQALPQLMIALRIKPPVPEESALEKKAIAEKLPAPVLIEDVWAWKAGLRISEGPQPVVDLKTYEEIEA